MRASAACAATAANPYVFSARAAHPAPVATPGGQALAAAGACLVAHLDLLPQREIGRRIKRPRPYDRQRVVAHPMSPLGLTRTGRAPSLLLLNPRMIALQTRLWRHPSPFRFLHTATMVRCSPRRMDQALEVLVGLPLRSMGRAADLEWFGFGHPREVPKRNGGTKIVEDWALHVQCAWRLTGA